MILRGNEGAGADDVACRNRDRIGVALAQRLRRGREMRDAPRRNPDRMAAGTWGLDSHLWRLEVAVEVVNGENLDLDGRRRGNGRGRVSPEHNRKHR